MGITARELPSTRRKIMEWTQEHGADWYELMIASGNQPIRPAVNARIAAQMLASDEVERLKRADLWYARADMVALTETASETMPSFQPIITDIPSRNGFVWFEEPICHIRCDNPTEKEAMNILISRVVEVARYTRTRDNDKIINSLIVTMALSHGIESDKMIETISSLPNCDDVRERMYEACGIVPRDDVAPAGDLPTVVNICGISWGPYDHGFSGTKASCTRIWFSVYSYSPEMSHLAILGPGFHGMRRTSSFATEYVVDTEAIITFAEDADAARRHGIAPLNSDLGVSSGIVFRAMTLFRLMRQTGIAETGKMVPARPERRRSERIGISDGPVNLVYVRRGSSCVKHASGKRGPYSTRWVVSGHWRQHWYPRLEIHRPMWISPYVKGPEDAPLKGGERVNVL